MGLYGRQKWTCAKRKLSRAAPHTARKSVPGSALVMQALHGASHPRGERWNDPLAAVVAPRPHTVHAMQRGGAVASPRHGQRISSAAPKNAAFQPRPPTSSPRTRDAADDTRQARRQSPDVASLERWERWLAEEEHAILAATKRAENWQRRAAAESSSPKPSRFLRDT